MIRAAIARSSGDLERCVVMGRRALELLPETEFTLRERAAARTNVALAYLVSGDVAPANERPLKEATASFRASSTLIPLLMSINFLARMRTLQGRLRMAAATYEEAVAAVSGREGLRDLVNNAAYYVGLGDIHREWNDLDSAERYLKRGVDLFTGTLMVDADVVTHGYLSLTRLLQTRGRHADARATLEEFADLARQRDFFPLLLARGEAAQARLALMHDDFPSAVSWAEDSGLGVDDEVGYPSEEGYLTLARVLVARGRVDQTGHLFDEGLRLLDRLLDAAEAGARMGSVIEIQALRALTLHARSEPRGAFAALERALVLAEPEGYVRVFVDEGDPMKTLLSELVKARRKGSRDARKHAVLGYARRLLAQGQDRSRFDPLTAREREVLELIAEGLSNPEIAARLFIAVSTVKGYVHIIFRKLDADSRTIAVARARELQLFSE